jgi:hypothetical protein
MERRIPRDMAMPNASKILRLGAACALLAGCSSVPIPPTYTQGELKAICERRGGIWYPDDLMGGFCVYRRAQSRNTSSVALAQSR